MDEYSPDLFEKLIDRNPVNRREEQHASTVSDIIRSVRRNLLWLLNTTSCSEENPICDTKYVSKSVLNFGISDIGGKTEGQLRLADLERSIAEAIVRFEPRIRPTTLSVKALRGTHSSDAFTVRVEILGDLVGTTTDERIFFSPTLHLESGSFSV